MIIKQFEDKNLAHYSYAIVSNGEVALIDPSRNPEPYYEFAKENKATIKAVIETHPHADFISSHLEVHNTTGATIHVSKLVGAEYTHNAFDEGDEIAIGKVKLKALNTPGHSPDSISILLINENGKEEAVFTGDTLFIGDCGRPDLRETAGAITAARTELAKQMYHSLRTKFITLPNDVMVYPAHGAGSLCGKGLSSESRSTIGAEKVSNWSLQDMTEDKFVAALLADQPYVPKYFPYDVGVNKRGASAFRESVNEVRVEPVTEQNFLPGVIIIDARPQQQFKAGHLKGAINLAKDTKFETWLGSIVGPGEHYYLIAENGADVNELVERIAKIGYEDQLLAAWVHQAGNEMSEILNADELKNDAELYTIIDVRNASEVRNGQVFSNAINIPLPSLRERVQEIPADKPVVVHCAAGYRSAAASSIIQSQLNGQAKVFDLGEAIKTFQK